MPVPTTQTTYDGGINGLSVEWFDDNPVIGAIPNRAAFTGAPKVHGLLAGPTNYNWGTGTPDAAIPVDNFSGRLSGLIYFGSTGTWGFGGTADDGLRLAIDDQLIFSSWTEPNVAKNGTFANSTVGWHRIQIDFKEDSGGASFQATYQSPGGSSVDIPNSALKPDLGLVTSSTAPTGTVTNIAYANPVLGWRHRQRSTRPTSR